MDKAPPKCELDAPAKNAISKIFFLIFFENVSTLENSSLCHLDPPVTKIVSPVT